MTEREDRSKIRGLTDDDARHFVAGVLVLAMALAGVRFWKERDQGGDESPAFFGETAHAHAVASVGPEPTGNVAPFADAGPDRTVFVGDTATLDGSGSTDADGDALSLRWVLRERPEGSSTALSNPSPVDSSFVIDRAGVYIVELVVSDGAAESFPDTVIVTTGNSAPVADAGKGQTAFLGDSVVLDGSGSSDVNGDRLTFGWVLVALPPESNAVLSDPTSVSPRLVADEPGTYVVRLVVNDGASSSVPDAVTITTDNSAPVADAGPGQTALPSDTVTLDGSSSTDADGEALTFSWSLSSMPPGSAASLSDRESIHPFFTVDVPGTYVAQLIVNDGYPGQIDSAPDTITITTTNSRPVADASDDSSAMVGDTVLLDAIGSTDFDGDMVTLQWSLTSMPDGSSAALSDPADLAPTFSADVAGTYVVQLIVNDGTADSDPDSVMVTVEPVKGAAAGKVDDSGPPLGGEGLGEPGLMSGESAGFGAVAGGRSHTLVVTPEGTVWAWGTNAYGELGSGTTTQRLVPGLVPSLSSIHSVSASYSLSLALETDGDLWAFGLNNNGQLGDGLTLNRSLPYKVMTGVSAMAAGEIHVLAVKMDGTVWAWGDNTHGQLGQGATSTTDRRTPVPVPGLSGVLRVAAGQYFSMALKGDGTVLAWGYNASGQLGQGHTTLRPSPTVIPGLSSIDSIAAGANHALALRLDGQVFGWGANGAGQVGDGTTGQNRLTPVFLLECPPVAGIAGGSQHSLAVAETGVVYAWGQQSSGQVGDGTTDASKPSPVALDAPDDVAALSAGYTHSTAVSRDGSVWAWGANWGGQIGDGTIAKRDAPVRVAEAGFAWLVGAPTFNPLPILSMPVSSVVVAITTPTPGAEIRYTTDEAEPTSSSSLYQSPGVTLSLSTTLKAKAFKSGQPPSNTTSGFYELRVSTPVMSPPGGTFTSPRTVTITTTTTGDQIRYTTDGSTPTETSSLYTGALTIGTKTTLRATGFKAGWTPSITPALIYNFSYGAATPPAVDPATGTHTDSVSVTMIAQSGATIRYTTNGTEPTTASTPYTAPLVLASTTTVKAKAFHPDYTTSATTVRVYTIQLSPPVLSPDTGTYSVGQTVTLSAHPGSTIRYTVNGATPTATDPGVAPGTSLRIVATTTIQAASYRTGAVTSALTTATYAISGAPADAAVDGGFASSIAKLPSGTLWVWGRNFEGQLGNGTKDEQRSPVALFSPTGVTQAEMGGFHTLSVDAAVARAWGDNANGKLGNGGTTDSSTPVPVSLPGVVSRVAASWGHSLALKTDGTVWAFGGNASGQLGNKTICNCVNSTPIQVRDQAGTGFLTGAVAIAAGTSHSLALKSNGTVVAWGSNQYGQIGQPSTVTQRTTPFPVNGFPAATVIVAIAAGDNHSLALAGNGKVYAWGLGGSGRLGTGAYANAYAPAQSLTPAGARAIAAGGQHSLAALADGTVYAFGENYSGQLGTGTGSTPTPTRVGSLLGVVAIGAGSNHSLAVDVDGQVWAWGNNGYGQLGDGTTDAKNLPTRVSEPSYTWVVGTPVFAPGGSHYTTAQNVKVSCATAGATIHYTTNGVDPEPSDPTVVSGETLPVDVSLILKAKAFKTGLAPSLVTAETYELRVQNVIGTPPPTLYNTPQAVSLSTTAPGATIRYTTDGTAPTEVSELYTAPIVVNATTLVRAVGFKNGWSDSNVAILTYTMKVGTPQLSPPPMIYPSAQTVTVTTASPGATLRYSLGGSPPTESSPVVPVGGIAIGESAILSVQGFQFGWTASDTTVGSYVVSVGAAATPTFRPGGGSYPDAQTVEVASATEGARIRYTLDGTDPTPSSPLVTGLVTVDASATLKARAYRADFLPSSSGSAAYIISSSAVGAPSFSPPGGTYTTLRTVRLTSATSGAVIHYTTDGSDPTPSSLWVVSGGTAVVDRASRLKARAYATGYPTTPPPSPIRYADYRITGAVAAGYDSGLALKTDGILHAWGTNAHGAVGNGTTTAVDAPIAVPGMTSVVAIAAANSALGISFAVKADGSLWGWGGNNQGQLGIGSIVTPQKSPQRVKSPSGAGFLGGIVALSSGPSHTLAVTSTGQVYGWGFNQAGQTGAGSVVTPKTLPVLVPGLSNVVAVAAGQTHSLALKQDGTVYAWGFNGRGVLGTGDSTTPVLIPVPVVGLSNVVAIAAAGNWSFAIRAEDSVNRSLWSWGDGVQAGGKLFDGNANVLRTTPARVGDGLAVSGSSSATLVYRREATGRGMIWGAGIHNASGLSPGSTYTSTVPVHVAGGEFLSFSMGVSVSTAIRPELTVLAWGPHARDGSGFSLGPAGAFTEDPDGDGLTTAREWDFGSDPFDSDTNGDGILDGADVSSGRSPTNPDVDGDGVLNVQERAQGTDPFRADTDGDGYGDGADAFPLDPTRWQPPPPTGGDTTPPVITLTEPTNAILISSNP